jgi:branched-chain amino acid transport system substrate-binding protein
MSRSLERLRRVGAPLAIVALLSSCAHRMDGEEMLAANGGLPAGAGASAPGAGADPGELASPLDSGGEADDGETDAFGGGVAPGGEGPVPGGEAPEPTAPAQDEATGDASAPCTTPDETGPIVVGSVGNYSGLGSSSAVQSLNAVNAWVEHVNARGGVCGRRVQLISVDDRADPAQTRAALQDLVSRGVVAFVNNWQPLTSASGIDYIDSVEVPVIGSACSSPAEFQSLYFFLPCLHYDDFIFAAARTAALYGGPSNRWGLVSCREAAACRDVRSALIGGGVAAEAGLEVVREIQSSVLQADFTSECRSLRDAGADKVFVVLDLASLNRFVGSCSRQGYNPVYVQLSSSIDVTTNELPGMQVIAVTGGFSFVDRSTPAAVEFQDVMATYLGVTPGPGEGVGWLSAQLLQAAIETAGRSSGSITSATLVEALRTFEGETLRGLSTPLTFSEGLASPAPCWWVTEGDESGWRVLNNGEPLCR